MAEAEGKKTSVTFAESAMESVGEAVGAVTEAVMSASAAAAPSSGAAAPIAHNVANPAPAPAPPKAKGKAKPKAKAAEGEDDQEAPKRKRLIPIPKDSASFFKARAKDVKAFTFTRDGNLSVPEMRGEPAKIIELPFYRKATIDEIHEKEESIKDALVSVEQEFDETAKLLRESVANWRLSGVASDVLQHQRTLTRLDAQRTSIRSPLR
jgi:hypothetical protein